MTSVDVRIYEDESDSLLRSFSVPVDCLDGKHKNSFSTTFSSVNQQSTSCSSLNWNPLDLCRKYKLEIEPEYLSACRGKSVGTELFTSGIGKI